MICSEISDKNRDWPEAGPNPNVRDRRLRTTYNRRKDSGTGAETIDEESRIEGGASPIKSCSSYRARAKESRQGASCRTEAGLLLSHR